MIDDKKIKEAARENILFNHRTADITLSDKDLEKFGKANFIQGAHWATNEFLKELWHPANEVARNDYTEILAVCKEPYPPMIFNLEQILNDAPDDAESYDKIWELLCFDYKITKYVYIGDLLPKKGGENG